MTEPTAPRAYRLRSRLLLLVSVLVGLVVASGAGTALTAVTSRRAILTAHGYEVASRRAALLSVIAREQYIHEAHTIIVRDRSHVEHHDEWVKKLDAELEALRAEVGAEAEAARLDLIHSSSHELSEIFARSILPAVDRQEWDKVIPAHDRANAIVDTMTQHADALAAHFDQQAVRAEAEAERLVRIALAAAVAAGVAAAALAAFAARRLWRSLSAPLSSLDAVARRVTAGDREARVPPIAAAELAVLADAFNRMLDALSRAEAEVVASERLAAIGRIAAGVAHEINNPIAVIRGYLKTMVEEAAGPELREELMILDEEAVACQRIAEDLLVYARAPALALRPAEASELLREAVERAESPSSLRAAGAESARVALDAEPAMVLVDPLRLRQVVVNLVNNAREAGAGAEPVEVRGERIGDGYRIEVLDRGGGLSGEARDRLFEPFFSTRRNGTGLGLAVCYGLVTAHGGSIRAEPRSGGGTRFVVELPAVVIEEHEVGAGAHASGRSPGTGLA
ncbi:MAG: HAMP domain-containing histidine kinase [Polyangiaceae bacterium]|nr:HAMP domain-containing histidine kinase [Polyangiaceae bacterium]